MTGTEKLWKAKDEKKIQLCKNFLGAGAHYGVHCLFLEAPHHSHNVVLQPFL